MTAMTATSTTTTKTITAAAAAERKEEDARSSTRKYSKSVHSHAPRHKQQKYR